MNGILICAGEAQEKNIGDYIQSVAQEQFFEHTDCYVEREHLDTFKAKEKVNVIMNAWFMWHPENFPPSDIINPLFISFHLVPSIADRFLTKETISYLKKYEPIGARDTNTQALLEKHGIKSYFSGCLTLTLGLKYKIKQKNNLIYFVDPFYELGKGENCKFLRVISALRLFFKNPIKIIRLNKIFALESHTSLSKISPKLDRLLLCASFYNCYSKKFSDELLFNAKYFTHQVKQCLFSCDDDKMAYARDLINKYAKAKLIITSRIHCALPCLGVETPVLFVNSNKLDQGVRRSGGRFGGLINLLHTLRWTPDGIVSDSIRIEGKINSKTIIENKPDYKKYKEELIVKVREFLNKNE